MKRFQGHAVQVWTRSQSNCDLLWKRGTRKPCLRIPLGSPVNIVPPKLRPYSLYRT